MIVSVRANWLWALILAGASYGFIGIAFAIPSSHAHAWRLAAWAVSGVIYILHIAYEQYWVGAARFRAAAHVAIGAAIGGFLIAAGALVHAVIFSAPVPLWRFGVALFAFPIITFVPALLVALVLAFVLSRLINGTRR